MHQLQSGQQTVYPDELNISGNDPGDGAKESWFQWMRKCGALSTELHGQERHRGTEGLNAVALVVHHRALQTRQRRILQTTALISEVQGWHDIDAKAYAATSRDVCKCGWESLQDPRSAASV